MVRFAAHVYGRFTLNYSARNMDNLLVGWRFNAVALGFYKKAYDLFALSALVQSLTSVAVSALSKLNGDSQQYKRYLLRALSVAAFVGMGMGAVFYSDRQGRDSFAVRAGVGAGRPDLHVLRPGMGDVSLRHPQLDPPFHWPARPMVSLGHHRVRLHWPAVSGRAPVGSCGGCDELEFVPLHPHDPGVVVCRQTD